MNVSKCLVKRERDIEVQSISTLRTMAVPSVLARYSAFLGWIHLKRQIHRQNSTWRLLEVYYTLHKSLHFYRKSQHQGQRKMESKMTNYLLYIVIKSDFQVNTNIDFQFALFHRHTSLSFTHSFSRCRCSWTRTPHNTTQRKRREEEKKTHTRPELVCLNAQLCFIRCSREELFSCSWAAPHTKSEFTIKSNKFK